MGERIYLIDKFECVYLFTKPPELDTSDDGLLILFDVLFQNGFVECEKENCPVVDDCYMLEKKNGCCEKCKGKGKQKYEHDTIILFYIDP